VGEKRGALGEKDRENRHTNLFHAVAGVATTARTGDFLHTLTYCLDDIVKLERGGPFFEGITQLEA
jgi:hypothetical protein